MWSLPDIKRMNEEAQQEAFREQLQKGLNGEEEVECMFCDKPATLIQEYYDIFSDDPKGVVGLCEKHEEDYGPVPEGYFYCEHCNRLFVTNYTWENYHTESEDGDIVCLNCRAKEYIEDQDNWIPLNDDEIYNLDFSRIKKSPHIIAVEGPIPEGIRFYKNVELDSSTGGRITGFSSSESSPQGGVLEMQRILQQAKDAGYDEALLILDGAFQFAVSIGVYVRA